MTRVV